MPELGGPRVYGLPHPKEFDQESGSQGGDFFILRGGMGPSHVVLSPWSPQMDYLNGLPLKIIFKMSTV